jgi:hypothetical protein
LDRAADYHSGRNEDQLQLQTYRGLLAVRNHPRDAKAPLNASELVRRFAFLGDSNDEARHAELVKLLNREFASAPETDYAGLLNCSLNMS